METIIKLAFFNKKSILKDNFVFGCEVVVLLRYTQ